MVLYTELWWLFLGGYALLLSKMPPTLALAMSVLSLAAYIPLGQPDKVAAIAMAGVLIFYFAAQWATKEAE